MTMPSARFHRPLLALTLALLVSACGWQLRGVQGYTGPSELTLVPAARYAPLTQAVEEAAARSRLTLTGTAQWQLHLGQEHLHKRTVAVTRIGSPSQYELSLSARFHYQPSPAHTGDEAPTLPVTHSLSVERVFDYDPSNTVAKREEENALLDEMRRELAQRILLQAPRQP